MAEERAAFGDCDTATGGCLVRRRRLHRVRRRQNSTPGIPQHAATQTTARITVGINDSLPDMGFGTQVVVESTGRIDELDLLRLGGTNKLQLML